MSGKKNHMLDNLQEHGVMMSDSISKFNLSTHS